MNHLLNFNISLICIGCYYLLIGLISVIEYGYKTIYT